MNWKSSGVFGDWDGISGELDLGVVPVLEELSAMKVLTIKFGMDTHSFTCVRGHTRVAIRAIAVGVPKVRVMQGE